MTEQHPSLAGSPIDKRWYDIITSRVAADNLAQLDTAVVTSRLGKHPVYPPPENVFAALNLVAPDNVSVVILGQDPYHGLNQAHGLSFSVQHGQQLPPSLRNIYKELEADLDIPPAPHGCLTAWARQGVLLLNASLTVFDSMPGSHKTYGWETITDNIVQHVASQLTPVVFILWGNDARKKEGWIDAERHLIISSAHPSPLSARRGFFGSRPFSRANSFLAAQGRSPIDWAAHR